MSFVPPSDPRPDASASPQGGDGDGKSATERLGGLFNRLKNAALAEPDAQRDAFFRAAKRGDMAAVKAAVDAGFAPDTYNASGETALHIAARDNKTEMVALLIALGADPRRGIQHDAARGPLQEAVAFGAEDAAARLLQLGAYASGEAGAQLLHRAIEKGKARIVEALLQTGADATALNATNMTPLMTALKAKQNDIAVLLLQTQDVVCSLNLPMPLDDEGRTPFHLGVYRGDETLVGRMIACGGFVNHAKADGLTPLLLAIQRGHVEIVKLLLAEGASPARAVEDPQQPGRQLQPPPLHYLCGLMNMNEQDRAEIARLLVLSGADVHASDADGQLPLHRLMRAHNIGPALRVLLEAGASVHRAARDGLTPLIGAIEGATIHEVTNLLSAGADPNGRHGADARTPLMVAAALGQADTVRELLQAGANPRLLDAHGQSAMFFARANLRHATTIVPLLEDALKRDAKPLFRGRGPGTGPVP